MYFGGPIAGPDTQQPQATVMARAGKNLELPAFVVVLFTPNHTYSYTFLPLVTPRHWGTDGGQPHACHDDTPSSAGWRCGRGRWGLANILNSEVTYGATKEMKKVRGLT